MNIQIFGTKKCNDTKKAERFFKERGIKYQFIDMKEKGMSKGDDFVIIGLNQLETAKIKGFQKIWSYDFLQRSKHRTSERRIKLNKVS